MDFSHFRMLGFGWESGFGWELLDCGGGFGLCGCFLVWVGACFLLEIFAGSVLLSFLTRLQVGVLDLVMWPWCSRVIKYIFGSLHQIQLTVVLRTSAVVIRCLCSPLGVLGVPLPSFLNSNKDLEGLVLWVFMNPGTEYSSDSSSTMVWAPWDILAISSWTT